MPTDLMMLKIGSVFSAKPDPPPFFPDPNSNGKEQMEFRWCWVSPFSLSPFHFSPKYLLSIFPRRPENQNRQAPSWRRSYRSSADQHRHAWICRGHGVKKTRRRRVAVDRRSRLPTHPEWTLKSCTGYPVGRTAGYPGRKT